MITIYCCVEDSNFVTSVGNAEAGMMTQRCLQVLSILSALKMGNLFYELP